MQCTLYEVHGYQRHLSIFYYTFLKRSSTNELIVVYKSDKCKN